MGQKGRCKRNKRKKIYCKCKRSENLCNISQIKEINEDVFIGEEIKKGIHKSKKYDDRKS